MSSWAAIDEELARWRDAGRAPTLWWRDDDAVDATPALDRLLALQRTLGVPLALAVVPAGADAGAGGAACAGEPAIDLLQHGYAHRQPCPARREEGRARARSAPAMMVLGELGTGWLALERLFGAARAAGAGAALEPHRARPRAALPEIGFRGLSTFGVRARARRRFAGACRSTRMST